VPRVGRGFWCWCFVIYLSVTQVTRH
jgi:hypothetical protein